MGHGVHNERERRREQAHWGKKARRDRREEGASRSMEESGNQLITDTRRRGKKVGPGVMLVERERER